VVGITGSVGKTSVKDICRAILPMRVHASRENFNTEIGLPLAICEAPPETEALVLEMAMRGRGQIAVLSRIAEPDVGAITNIGPVHLELLGTMDVIAEAKAEILGGLGDRGRAVIPADEEALEPHLRESLVTITFGPGGDVFCRSYESDGRSIEAAVGTPDGEQIFRFPFGELHNLQNALAAIAIGTALEAPLGEMSRRAPRITFSRLRGELIELPGEIVLVNDCYNANPVSMRAALDHLASLGKERRVAVLGEMLELGSDAEQYHREAGAHARGLGIGPILGVGELGRDYAPDAWAPDAEAAIPLADAMVEPGDAVLIKGSRGVGLELVTDELAARRRADGE
jgi:UDP-N-acetylmuramoyl-tripeptide--D-alanyl-D-alanine ligase